MRKAILIVFTAGASLLIAAVALYQLPPVHERLAWRIDNLQAKLLYAIRPPEKVIFVPQDQVAAIVAATLQALTPSPTPTSSPTPLASSATPAPSATPTLQPTPIPAMVDLGGIKHEYQKWNNCGPDTLAMALSFWGWKGNQYDTRAVLRPNDRDKNVMPYEMVDYVNQETELKAVYREGGDLDLLKRLIAAGFPVVIEKGFEVPDEGWMGHYLALNGYDDGKGVFITQDSYIGPNHPVAYDALYNDWRAFNYTYIVIYPREREVEVQALLGADWDETYALQSAAQRASNEIYQLTGRDQYFAWYNRGTSLVGLNDYAGAALAYDEAFKIYPTIPEKKRPWRMLWYQTGPYFAYYYTGRYQDVVNLATATLGMIDEPAIEETWVWRARAEIALGQRELAIDDLRNALKWHPGFAPAQDALASLGAQP